MGPKLWDRAGIARRIWRAVSAMNQRASVVVGEQFEHDRMQPVEMVRAVEARSADAAAPGFRLRAVVAI
jgi:hypothetical protein